MRAHLALLLGGALLAAGAAGAPFTAGSLVVVGVGNGTTLATNLVQGSLFEISPSTGAVLQRIYLPNVTTTGSYQCNFYGSSNAEAKMTATLAGDKLVIPCYNAVVGLTFSGVTTFTAAVVSYDGSVDTSTSCTGTAANFRGLASVDGSYFYAGTSSGVRGFAYGSTAATALTQLTSTTSGSLGHIGFFSGAMYASWYSSTYGLARPFLAPYPTTTGSALISAAVLSGTAASGSLHASFHFQDAATLFTVAYATSGTLGHMQKYLLSGSVWAQPAGWPKLTISYVGPTGSTITPSGLKSIAGLQDPGAGAYVLYVVTSAPTTGANAVVRFNTATEAWTHVATAPAYMNWQAVAWAPVAPSATASPSATATTGGSPSGTGTPPATATPSRTASPPPTGTPSGTASPSGTPSPTGTALCAPVAAAPAPFGRDNLVVLRVGAGSGRDVVGTAAVAREAYLDEYTQAGALMQTIALPTGPAVLNATGGLVSAGCTINQALLTNGLLSRAVDGRTLALACLPLNPGTVPVAGVNKTVMSVRADGTVAAVALMTSYLGSTGTLTADGGGTSVTGAVTPDGFTYWFGTSSGTFWMQAGRVGTGQVVSTTAAGALALSGGYVFRVVASSGAMSVLGTAAMGATPPNTYTNAYTTGASSASAGNTGLWMPDGRTAYILDGGTSASTPTISKFTRADDVYGTSFTVAPGYPVVGFTVDVGGVPTTVYDGRGLTGLVDAGGLQQLFFTSSVGLVRYTPSDGSFALLAQPCDTSGTMRFQGIAVAPYVPPPTPSATATRSLTATPSATSSQGASPSGTSSGSATASASLTATASLTASSTPLCAPPTAAPAPFGRDNYVVLRLGSGRAPIAAGAAIAREGFIDEYTPNGALVQTIALPTGPAVLNATGGLVSAGCTFNGALPAAGQVSRAADGRTLVLVCHPAAPGAALASGGNKTVLAVRHDGTLAPLAVMTSYLSTSGTLTAGGGATAAAYTAVTPNGRDVWFTSGAGSFYVAAGTVGAGQHASTTATLGAQWLGGFVYAVRSATGTLAILGTSASVETTPGVGVYTNSLGLTGAVTGSASSAGLWMPDPLTAFIVDSSGNASLPTISRFTRLDPAAASPWTLSTGYPVYGFSVDVDGAPVAVADVRGVTGFAAPDGGVVLLLATAAGLVRFTPALAADAPGRFVLLAAPCDATGTMRFQGVALAPWVPSPTASPTGSPSLTATSTATVSSGATASITSTASPSAAATTTPTPSATASATALCAPPTAAPVPFTPGNLVLLRVGNGRDELDATSVGRPIFLDEVNPASGALVQTIGLPVGPVVLNATGGIASAGCVANGAQPANALLTRSGDGLSLALACHAAYPGDAITAAVNKSVYAVRWDGTAAPVAVMTSYVSSGGTLTSTSAGGASLGGAVTATGRFYWFTASSGVFSVAAGAVGPGYQASTTAGGGAALVDGYVYFTSLAGQLRVAANSTAAATLPLSYSNSLSLPDALTGTTTASAAGVHFSDARTVFIADASLADGTPTVSKFTRPTAGYVDTWSPAPGYPLRGLNLTGSGATVNDARGLTSVADPVTGSLTLYAATSAGLVAFSETAQTAALVAAPCSGQSRWQGVAVAPALPSPTGTPTPSRTPTASLGTSPSPSGTLTPTPSGTPSLTATPTALCGQPAASPAPFTPGSVTVVRLGDGRAALPASGVAAPVFLEEIDPATGALLQTIALPTGGVVATPASGLASAGCTLSSSPFVATGLATRAAGGQEVVLACLPLAPGAAITATVPKTLLTARYDGVVAARAVMTQYYTSGGTLTDGGLNGTISGAVADAAGNAWFATGGGTLSMPLSRGIGAGQVASTTAAVGLALQGGFVYRLGRTGVVGVLGNSSSQFTVPNYYANSLTLSGATIASITGAGLFFQDGVTLWVSDGNTAAGTATLTRFTRPAELIADAWSVTAGYPVRGYTVTVGGAGGSPQTAYDARGLTGRADAGAAGGFSLLFVGSLGLVRFTPGAAAGAQFEWVAAPCSGASRYLGVALSPVAPSASPSGTPPATGTPTASGTPSTSATATASLSPGGTPSGTGSPTPSPSKSLTASPTGTPSGTPQCAPAAAAPAPFGRGNVAVLRLGNGLSALPTTAVAREGFIDEYTPNGALVQSIALPTGGLVLNATGGLVSAGCTVSASTASPQGLLGRAPDGRSLVLACTPAAVGAALAAGDARVVLSVQADGSVVTEAALTSYLSSTGVLTAGTLSATLGGAATDGAGNFWFATGGGVLWAPAGRVGTGAVASTTAAVGAAYVAPWAYRVSTSGNLGVLGSATTGGTPPGYANSLALPGAATGSASAAGLWMPDPLTAFIVDAGTTALLTPTLSKFTRPDDGLATAWVPAPGYPKLYGSAVAIAGGGPSTLPDARGVAGVRDGATGNCTLYLTTSAGLLRYDEASASWALLAAPCGGAAGMRFLGVAMAPAIPSPTASGTASATASRSPTASLSAGASPSPTTSPTASASPPPTATPTPSPTGTLPCAPAAASPAPFTPGNLAVLRLGGGRDDLPSTGAVAREAFIDEINPATGGRVQSIALPPASCTLSQANLANGQLSLAPDGLSLVAACLAQPPGTPVTATGNKSVVSVGVGGVVTLEAALTSYLSSTGALVDGGGSGSVGGAVTDGAGNFWVASATSAIWVGRGANGTTGQVASTTASVSVAYVAPYVFRLSSAGAVSALASASTVASTAPGVYTSSVSLSGLTIASSAAAALWVAPGGLVAYVLDGASTTAALSRFNRSGTALSAAWAASPGWPVAKAPAALAGGGTVAWADARGLTGVVAPGGGATVLYFSTSAGLVSYAEGGGGFTLVAAPCDAARMRFAGVAPVPAEPTPSPSGTPSRTGSPAATASGSGTGTPSPTPSRSPPGTPSPTPSRTGTPTRSNSPTLTASGTASVSASGSETASVSASQTGTPSTSVSGTATPSPSGSASATGTPPPSASASGSATAAPTPPPSASGTPAGTPPPSGSPSKSRLPSATPTRTRTGSRTRTATATRTRSATKTKTRTKTRTPSKKKLLRE